MGWSDSFRSWNFAALKTLLLPGGILLLTAIALAYSGWLTLPLPAISFLYYCATAGGMLLSWRFHSSRMFLALLVVLLAGQAVSLSAAQPSLLSMIVRILAVLLPVNFVLIAGMSERGFTLSSIAPVGLLLFVETLVVAVLSGTEAQMPLPRAHLHQAAAEMISFPGYALVIITASVVFIAVRFVFTRKLVDAALLWSLAAFLLSLRFAETARLTTLYATTAATILAASIVENSYLLAYHDELTGLPSRRAFNGALLRLRAPYSIAMIDVDHFKRFNDTYGHETGDQVLRLVAANLARTTGGGQAYRCGGEEFTILFPGKTTSEVVDHLETLRGAIQRSEFRLRASERRQVSRGPDRRSPAPRRRTTKGQAIRQLAKESGPAAVSVTVSIGVAHALEEKSSPEATLEAADKALYSAKANGRNRVEMAAAPRRTRAQTAGIA
jgi:diguanylate cyclase (GGDEF)-like protein